MTFERAKKKQDWRDQLVPREDFQCACGCELQLSAGDLADAIRCALPFGGRPRTWGVMFTSFVQRDERKREAEEPMEKQICSGCRSAVVEIPAFAASLLRDHGANWPRCEKCRSV